MCFELNSCFCFTLNTGTKLIGFLFTIISALMAVMYGTPAILMEHRSSYKSIFYTSMTLIASVQFIAAILLIYGAFQKKPKWMWPWIVVAMLQSYTFIVYSASWTILLNLSYLEDNGQFNVVISVFLVYAFFVQFCVLVVNSRRRELAALTDPLCEDVVINGTQSSTRLLAGGPAVSDDFIV